MRDKRVLISALVVFFLGITLLYLFNKSISYEKQEVISKQMDSLLLTLENRLEQVSKVALTSSIILSKNQHIIESLKYQEREPCLEHLMLIKNSLTFEKVINNIEFHLHTDEFKSLLRLWDYKSKSKDDLSGFRHSLNKVKQTKESVYGVEVGRFGMFMRAISPVTEANEYLGTIESVVDFSELNDYFASEEITFYALLKNEYLPIVTSAKFDKNLKIDNYTIVNQKTNGLNFIREVNFIGTNYFKVGDNYVLYMPIIDINANEVGFYVLTWSEKLSLATFK